MYHHLLKNTFIMKTIQKNLLAAGLLLAATVASAQSVSLETTMGHLLSEYGGELCTNKTVSELRDYTKPGHPLQSRCEMYYFTVMKKTAYQRELLDEMIRAMERAGREDANCYAVNSMIGQEKGPLPSPRLMIGENKNHYIEIGKDYDNYWNVNAIDTADETKSHRYAYAVEWREKGKTIELRYIVTYARIPSAASTLTSSDWPYLDLGKTSVKPLDRITITGPDVRLQWNGKGYSLQEADSVIREARKRSEELSRRLRNGQFGSIPQEFGTDTVVSDSDPVKAVVLSLQQKRDVTAQDLLCDDNVLLIFSLLKQQYLAGQNREFNAISVYTLCKKAREYGFFSPIPGFPDEINKAQKTELEQLKREVTALMDMTPKTDDTTQDRIYFGLALSQLEQIK